MHGFVFFLALTMAKKKKKNSKEKEKKTKSSKDFTGNLILEIQTIHALYERMLERSFRKFDLSNEQFLIMRILSEGQDEGISLKQIRKALPNHTSNTTRLVEKLKIKNLVTKKPFKLDKRQLRISLTVEGEKALNKLNGKIKEIDDRLNSTVKSKNLKILMSYLNKITSELNVS